MDRMDNTRCDDREVGKARGTTVKGGIHSSKPTLIVITITPEDLEKYFPLRSGIFSTLNKAESCKLVALIYIVGNKCRLTPSQLRTFTGDGIYKKNDVLVEMYDAPPSLVKLTEEVILTESLDELFSDYCKQKVLVQICPSLGIVNTQWEESAHSFLSKRGHPVITTFEPEFAPNEYLPDPGDDDDVDPDTRAAFVKAHRLELGLEASLAEDNSPVNDQGQGEPAHHQQQPSDSSSKDKKKQQSGDKIKSQQNFIDKPPSEVELLKLRIIDMAHDAKRGTALHYLNIGVMADELFRRGVLHESLDVFVEEQVNHLLIEGLHESGNFEATHSLGRGDLTGAEIVDRVCTRLQTTEEISAKLESILSITKHTSNFLMSNQPYKFGDMAIATTYVPQAEGNDKEEGKKAVSFGDDAKKNDQEQSSKQGKTVMWSAFKKKSN